MPGLHFQLARCAGLLHDARAEAQEQSLARVEAGRDEQALEASALTADARKAESSGNWAGAAEIYQKTLLLMPDDPMLLYDRALALRNSGDVPAATALLQSTFSRGIVSAKLRTLHAILMEAQGDPVTAESDLRQALRCEPSSALVLTNLGALLGKRGQLHEADTLLSLAIETDPLSQDALVNLALLSATEGNFSRARELLHRALQIRGDHDRATAALRAICAAPNSTCPK